MKLKPQSNSSSIFASAGSFVLLGFRSAVNIVRRFFSRVKKSILLMTALEKRLVICLLVLAVFAGTLKSYDAYVNETKPIPDFGGSYSEAIAGNLVDLNPIWVQTDADRSAAHLVFSSLIRFDGDRVVPDLAERWDISPDGKTYTFYLRKDVLFHDGTPLSADDVAFTIKAIKDTASGSSQSPFLDIWRDVTVNVKDKYQISFELPKPYGPFLTHVDVGIMPGGVSPDDFNKRFIGSGPFMVEKVRQENGKNLELDLVKNESYYRDRALLKQVKLFFFDKEDDAKKAFEQKKVQGLFGTDSDRTNAIDLAYKSSKRFGLIFNLNNDRFKDKDFRRKIIQGEKMDVPVKVRLVTLSSPLQKEKAEELRADLASQNIQLENIYLSSVQLNDVINSHEFEMLLYGFDFGHDRDPYAFWHSSQLDKHNISGYSDKQSDILLEDARMATDESVRNQKYDQFFGILQSEYLAKFWDPIKYSFHIDPSIKDVDSISGFEPGSQFDQITSWYVKEKKVKK